MAIIIALFTKEILARNPNQVESSEDKSYSEICERLCARFGRLPIHFQKRMREPQKQPYMHGDPHNVSYRNKCAHFNKPMPVPCEVTPDSCRKIDGCYTLGEKCIQGIDEPLPWMDRKYQVTLNFLKSLPDKSLLSINTRSDLIANDEYINELKRLIVVVNVIYHSKDDNVNRWLEPGAPSYERRMEAVKKLKENGISASLEWHDIPKQKKEVG